MRTISLPAVLITVVSFFTFMQLACQPAADTNRSDSAAPVNTNSGDTVDTASIEAELLRIENDWPRAIKEKDLAAIGRVEADDIVIVYPDGSLGSKNRDLQDIATGNLTADEIEMSDLKVKVLDSDAAVVTGQTEMKNAKYKTPDGKLQDISGRYRFVDTFARRNGEWKLVAGMSTKITATATSASAVASPTPATRVSPTTSPAVRATPARATPARATPAQTPPATSGTP
ncbi:MAG TPA: DUF4440 domain-containing protein [Pyrinomonadaceae bacterium]|nr:DUF4440 domain-containing protein [Pyrinomonadaceae bacterium]